MSYRRDLTSNALGLKLFLTFPYFWNQLILCFWSSTPQFHTDPLSSTHRFHIRTTPFSHAKSLSSTPKNPQFNTKIPQFHTTTPSVSPLKPLSSTPLPPQIHTKNIQFNSKILQFHTKIPQFHTKNSSVPHRKFFCSRSKSVCGTEGCVELTSFWCWTEGFRGWKGVALLCGTDVLNWGGGVELGETLLSHILCKFF